MFKLLNDFDEKEEFWRQTNEHYGAMLAKLDEK
jgi:hypothetical protein